MIKKFRGILIFLLIFFVNLSFAQVQISEIAWMGTSASSYDEWIELYNLSEEKVDLDNWTLSSVDGTPRINLTGEIPAKSYFLLERTDDTSISNAEADQIYTGSLSNSGEILVLKNEKGEEIDRTPATSWIAGENPAKKTMERQNFTISGTQESAWQTFQNESSYFLDAKENSILGSPRALNSGEIIFPVPENIEFVSHFDEVQITKINPVPLNSGEVWLEFSIKSDSAVDITNWEIKNTSQSQKLSELFKNKDIDTDGENLAGKYVHLNNQGIRKNSEKHLSPNFQLPEDRLIFSAKNKGDEIIFRIKSAPLALANNKELKIKEADKTLAKKVFTKDLRIIISEISPNHQENDFFELLVKESANPIDLKFMEIRHNGRTLFFAENSLIVKKGDLLTFQLQAKKISNKPRKYQNTTLLEEVGESFIWEKGTKNGLVASSGTMEIILWSGTSWEKNSEKNGETADFVCWAEKNLNKTETKRLAKNKPTNWAGDCVKLQKLAKNESIARSEPQIDTNNSRDFYRHFHGSPGAKNFIRNHKPKARIKLQSGKFAGKSKVNFTGLEKDFSASTDGDGLDDLVRFQWEINGKSCGDYEEDGWEWDNPNCYLQAQKGNPSYLYFDFDKYEEFEISLRVTDLAGYSDVEKIQISREKKLEIKNEDKSKEFNYETKVPDDFFAEFLTQTDLKKLKEIAYAKNQPAKIEPAPRYLFARDKFSAEQKSRMAKNIGLIFQ